MDPIVREFYNAAQSGRVVQDNGIISWIKGFEKIILWGAGNLGSAVSSILHSKGVHIHEFWDKRYQELSLCNGIPVRKPFHGAVESDGTLIIPCIVNGSLGDEWTISEVQRKGYKYILSGMEVFEGLACPLSIESPFDIEVCTRQKACSLCNCKRYVSILEHKNNITEKSLSFQLITFIISTVCTLKCKYCGQRMTEYAAQDRVIFPLSRILSDIDNFLSAVDFVGMISIIGGEPFVHKNIDEIVQHCLKYDNFGVVNITTNGVVGINKETLCKIRNPRVKISFSLYDDFLDEHQKKKLQSNIDLVKECGMNFSLSKPLWTLPGNIERQNRTFEQNRQRALKCQSRKMAASIRNGLFLPCTIIENATGLHLIDVSKDCVDITSAVGLRERLLHNLNSIPYEACSYCPDGNNLQIPAGEQA